MDAEGRESRIRRITWIGLFVNVGLIALKFVGGFVGHSRTVVADAVHSVSDLATDVAVLVGTRYWSQPSDPDHPYGHGRIETLVTVALGLFLAAVGVGIGYDAIVTIQEKHLRPPGIIALAAAFVSIVSKEALYRWTIYVGHQVHSSAVVANAWHHRSDALSSVPAVIAVGAAMVLPGWPILDHLGALMVCLFILQASYRIVRPAVRQLVDSGLPPRDIEAMYDAVRSRNGVLFAHALRTRYLGSAVAVDLHIEVDPHLSVADGHEIAEDVRHTLLTAFDGVADVVVHVDPLGVDPRHLDTGTGQPPP